LLANAKKSCSYNQDLWDKICLWLTKILWDENAGGYFGIEADQRWHQRLIGITFVYRPMKIIHLQYE